MNDIPHERQQRDFSYVDQPTGARFGVRIILDRHKETGIYSGRAETYRGEVENSSFLTNDLTIEGFEAPSYEQAFERAYALAAAEVARLIDISRAANT